MAKLSRLTTSIVVAVSCGVAPSTARSGSPETNVTPERLHNQITAVESSTELDEPTRARLIDLYRQSINNVEVRQVHEATAEEYRRLGQVATREAESLRTAIERIKASDPTIELGELSAISLPGATRRIDTELAMLTAAEARLSVLEGKLDTAARRPAQARARILAARGMIDDLTIGRGMSPDSDDPPQLTQAVSWARETRVEALRAELAMLDQELLTHGARTELMKAQRDEAESVVVRITRRIEILRAVVQEHHRAETARAVTEAQTALEGTSSDELLVRELAQSNLSIVEQLKGQMTQLAELATWERDRLDVAQIDRAFRSARRKLEAEGPRAPIGVTILEDRRRFPSVRGIGNELRAVGRTLADVSFRRIRAEEELEAMRDFESYLSRKMSAAGRETIGPSVRDDLSSLIATHRSLLDRSIANDAILQRLLYEHVDALRRIAERLRSYDEFLAERMLWIRSERAIGVTALARLPRELDAYFDLDPWRETIRVALARMTEAPSFGLLMVVAIALAAARPRIRNRIVDSGRAVGVVDVDDVRSTLSALALSALLAAPMPMVLAAIGGALSTAESESPFPTAVGRALVHVATWIALPVLMRAFLVPGGVAEAHFGWNASAVTRLRRQLGRFVIVVLPVYLVTATSIVVDPPDFAGGTLTFLGFAAMLLALFALIVATTHPTRGTIRELFDVDSARVQPRRGYVGFVLVVTAPLVLIALGWLGYVYAAEELAERAFESIWLVVAVWLVSAVVRRWLVMTGRRLARDEAVSESGAHVPGESERTGIERSDVDLAALDAGTRSLLRAAVVLTVILALAGIWGDVVPALGVLEDVGLWSHSVISGGVERTVPVSLLDVLIAAIIAIAGYVLAKNLPSLSDIILLKRGGISAGDRYTIGTLTRYAIAAATVLIVLRQLGASPSQLGWAAAALGVGIGFGLQEIVANFICGLVLLFERPVRVGDIVTIGDASGIVSKIRIRATTIRDWEEKELVVPNKEFITGRLLNWTLSDALIRIFITAGVAYGSDVDKAMGLIAEAAREHPLVVADPEPRVHFEQFGDSSLHLTLRAYISDVRNRLDVQTALHKAIDRKFRDAGVVIAFPQRDVHVRADRSRRNVAGVEPIDRELETERHDPSAEGGPTNTN